MGVERGKRQTLTHVGLVLLAAGALAAGFTGVVWAVTGELPNTNQTVAGLTSVLVGVTAWYAVQTHAMVAEMQTARDEERAARADAQRAHRHEQSRAFAFFCLDNLHSLTTQMRRIGSGQVDRSEFRQVAEALSHAGRFITDDDELQDHVLACAEVARVVSWPASTLKIERIDPAMAGLCLQGIATATESALVAYVTGKHRGAWHWDMSGDEGERRQYPTRQEAFAWIHREATSTR